MLEYVYIKRKRDTLKVPCSNSEGNLPDFSVCGLTEESYESGLKQHLAYEKAWENYESSEKLMKVSYAELFIKNFGLFCQNYQEILSTPKFFNIWYPLPFRGSRCGALVGTLGNAMQLWLKKDPAFCGKPRSDIGHDAMMHSLRHPADGVKPVHIVELLRHLGVFDEAEEARLLEYYTTSLKRPTIDDFDIIVPLIAFTKSFVVAALKAGLPFGYLPNRFKTQKFIDKIAAETDWTPNIGEISPKFLTAAICAKSLNANPNKVKQLIKLVPKHLEQEVSKMLKEVEGA